MKLSSHAGKSCAGNERSLTVKGHSRRGPRVQCGRCAIWVKLAVGERYGHWELRSALHDVHHAPMMADRRGHVGIVSAVTRGQAASPSPRGRWAVASIPGSSTAVLGVRNHGSPIKLYAPRADPRGRLMDKGSEMHLEGRVRAVPYLVEDRFRMILLVGKAWLPRNSEWHLKRGWSHVVGTRGDAVTENANERSRTTRRFSATRARAKSERVGVPRRRRWLLHFCGSRFPGTGNSGDEEKAGAYPL